MKSTASARSRKSRRARCLVRACICSHHALSPVLPSPQTPSSTASAAAAADGCLPRPAGQLPTPGDGISLNSVHGKMPPLFPPSPLLSASRNAEYAKMLIPGHSLGGKATGRTQPSTYSRLSAANGRGRGTKSGKRGAAKSGSRGRGSARGRGGAALPGLHTLRGKLPVGRGGRTTIPPILKPAPTRALLPFQNVPEEDGESVTMIYKMLAELGATVAVSVVRWVDIRADCKFAYLGTEFPARMSPLRCGEPTIWTILQQDGPNQLEMRYNVLPEYQMALITSGFVPFSMPEKGSIPSPSGSVSKSTAVFTGWTVQLKQIEAAKAGAACFHYFSITGWKGNVDGKIIHYRLHSGADLQRAMDANETKATKRAKIGKRKLQGGNMPPSKYGKTAAQVKAEGGGYAHAEVAEKKPGKRMPIRPASEWTEEERICVFCGFDAELGRAGKSVKDQTKKLGKWWKKHGFRGPAYCQKCRDTFNNHIRRELPNKADCNRSR